MDHADLGNTNFHNFQNPRMVADATSESSQHEVALHLFSKYF